MSSWQHSNVAPEAPLRTSETLELLLLLLLQTSAALAMGSKHPWVRGEFALSGSRTFVKQAFSSDLHMYPVATQCGASQ